MLHTDKLVEIFVKCDDFYQEFEQFLSARSIDPLKKTLCLKMWPKPFGNHDHRDFLSFQWV